MLGVPLSIIFPFKLFRTPRPPPPTKPPTPPPAPRAVPAPPRTFTCSVCKISRTEGKFSANQIKKKNDATRKCVLCAEVGPIVKAVLENWCMYCGTTQRELTKEHIIPRSHGGCWTLRSVCRPCNQRRGNSDAFPLLTRLQNHYPVLRSFALGHVARTFNNKSLSPNTKRKINRFSEFRNDGPRVIRELRLF